MLLGALRSPFVWRKRREPPSNGVCRKNIMTAHQRNLSASIDPVKLDRLAEVAVKVGLRLQPGQDLLLTAPSVALPLVRRIAEHAYKAGAGLVTPFLSDEEITLSRYRYGRDDSFDRAA